MRLTVQQLRQRLDAFPSDAVVAVISDAGSCLDDDLDLRLGDGVVELWTDAEAGYQNVDAPTR